MSLPDIGFMAREWGGGVVLTAQLQYQRLNAVYNRQVWKDRDQVSKMDTQNLATAESVMYSLGRIGHHLSLIR